MASDPWSSSAFAPNTNAAPTWTSSTWVRLDSTSRLICPTPLWSCVWMPCSQMASRAACTFTREEDLLNRRASLRLNAHDPGILESLMPLRLSGLGPSEFVLVGVVPQACQLGEGFSSTILTASTEALLTVARLLLSRGFPCQPRKISFQPNLWWLSGMPSRVGSCKSNVPPN